MKNKPKAIVQAQNHEKSMTAMHEKLLIDIAELAHLTSLSTRTLRRMDAAGEIPGRIKVGRRVLFQTEVIRAWVHAGLPDAREWENSQSNKRK